MKLVSYLRVSSKGQVDAFGPAVQRAAIKSWAKSHGHQIVLEAPLDVITGKADSNDRPGLLEAIRAVKARRAEGIIAYDFKRIARQLTVQEAILGLIWREGGRVFTTEDGEILSEESGDPMRDLIRQMMGAFAEFDRKTTVNRLREGREAKAALGKHANGDYIYGTMGVGSGRDRDAGPNPEEKRAIALMAELRGSGASYREVCTALTAEGIKPRRSATWQACSVRKICLREGVE
jgi:DNA invertase Pin-like site-specific DNA recombinase